MKKLNILASLFAGLVLTTACTSDRDSNPIYQEPSVFVLNTPAFVNGTYDLENSTTLQLTCSQPNYGYTAATMYAVQVSLSQSFTTFTELTTQYSTALMNVDVSELAVAATTMAVEAGYSGEDFPLDIPLYLRLRAYLPNATGAQAKGGDIVSNSITLPHVKLHYALPPVTLPENVWFIGSFNGWSWDTAPAGVMVNGTDNVFWRLLYLDGGFKINTATSWNGGEKGYGQVTIVDNAGANIGDDGGNIGVGNPGWYLVIVKTAVAGRDVTFEVDFEEAAVWMIGTVTGAGDSAWSEMLDGWKCTTPTTADGEFVSPAFAASAAADSGVRAYVKVPGYDWWKSEFMVFDGKIVYRATGGDQERVMGEAGQKLYLNFSNDTGRIE